MSLADELKIYPACEIRPVELSTDEIKDNVGAIYSAKILNVNPDDTIDFSIPVYLGEQVDLKRNTRYSFLFVHERGMKTAHGVFIQRIRIDNVPMAKVKLIGPLKKIQRRDYYRVGCHIDVKFQVIRMRQEEFSSPDYLDRVSEEIDEDAWKDGTIADISGGGLKFVSEHPLMDFPFLVFSFYIKTDKNKDSEKLVQVCGRMLSRQPIPRTLLCTYRVKFEPEHSKAQNDILAYVYLKQMDLNLKEKDK